MGSVPTGPLAVGRDVPNPRGGDCAKGDCAKDDCAREDRSRRNSMGCVAPGGGLRTARVRRMEQGMSLPPQGTWRRLDPVVRMGLGGDPANDAHASVSIASLPRVWQDFLDMKPPLLSPDEPERLKALRSYAVLDTREELPYDQITALAALICETPFSLVTLVDQERQWFKSRHGWEVPQSDRAISFCAHAIHESDLVVVPDATQDDRFRGNPDVTGGPRIRFYAGAPLVSPEGHALGTLCVLDRVPRELTADQEQALRVLGTHVMTLLELRRSKRRLGLTDEILNSLPGIFYVFDQEGRFLRWNRRFEEVTGYPPDELEALHPLDLFRGTGRELIQDRIRKVFEEGAADAEAELVGKEGALGAYYFTGRLLELEGEPCLVGMGLDVSRRRALEDERERLFNLSPDLLCVVGFDGRFRDVNPAWERVLGHARGELLGRSFMEFVHAEDGNRTDTELERNRQGAETRSFENRYRHRDGGWRWLSWSSSVDPVRGVVYGLARDVTREKEVAEALRKSEKRYRTLVESARDAILALGPGGEILSANRAFEDITGWEKEGWLGRSYEDLLHADDRSLGRELLGKLERDEEMPVFEVRVMAKDGKEIPVEVKGTAIEEEGKERKALLIARDVRARKALDARLRRIQRLDAVGRLAAGLAHDFNNVLGVVRTEVDLALGEGGLPGQVEEGLRNVRTAVERGAELATRLMGLSRSREPRFEAVELNDVLRRFDPMLRRLVGTACAIEVTLFPGRTTVQADSGMLEQVLMNLALNARDAMPEGGVLAVSTGRLQLDEETARRFPDAFAGPYVRLSVTDTGTGIALEDQPHIFEPLFTTKEEGEGTGLGLATVHSIIRSHGGWMDLESEPGSGSRFHLYLPAHGDPEEPGGFRWDVGR
jgi:PAS domain S-box-containing protein